MPFKVPRSILVILSLIIGIPIVLFLVVVLQVGIRRIHVTMVAHDRGVSYDYQNVIDLSEESLQGDSQKLFPQYPASEFTGPYLTKSHEGIDNEWGYTLAYFIHPRAVYIADFFQSDNWRSIENAEEIGFHKINGAWSRKDAIKMSQPYFKQYYGAEKQPAIKSYRYIDLKEGGDSFKLEYVVTPYEDFNYPVYVYPEKREIYVLEKPIFNAQHGQLAPLNTPMPPKLIKY